MQLNCLLAKAANIDSHSSIMAKYFNIAQFAQAKELTINCSKSNAKQLIMQPRVAL
jgi:hypothetical protein